ncbi:uncharacterized protein F4822DRAFT_355974 [Hypoxylon trugodes]|uniref:uncharacterized protein n=1 Tax=Hypoxylon trugodes TaxID=326681 RepID=UPI002191D5C1|nr:uncharacterized protein F4822DRAFT_355974 [Hypoxylon trugodes]KAI1385839.1 hypothetical protein F4822DRAFT_355974 [Hypoxylon trugodes]
METTPTQTPITKRKADDMAIDEDVEAQVAATPEEPASKKVKTDSTEAAHKHWNADMEMPEGKARPKFNGEDEEDRASGSGTVEDPKLVWLGKVPLDAELREANQTLAREAALSLDEVTHVYIRYAAQSNKFINRDGDRIRIFNPDTILFGHRSAKADPHMSLAFGTDAGTLSVYGYINVDVDEDGNPVDFASSRNPEYVIDGDDRIFELFFYEDEQQDCAPYCPTHAKNEKLVDACWLASARGCRHHNTQGLLDHHCPRPHWRANAFADHYCHCHHNVAGTLDHYCPCRHDRARLDVTSRHCRHKVTRKDRATGAHYCANYVF